MSLEPLVRCTRQAAVLAVLTLLILPAAAQEPASEGWQPLEAFGEEIAVEVVNLEVWVTDRQGRAVTGLGREDFELLVDGKPTPISNFAAYGGEVPEVPGRVGAGEWQTAAARDTTPDEDRLHLTVFLDHWNLRPEDRGRVFDDLRGFLEHQLAPGDRIAVAVHDLGLELVQGFTADRGELARTLDRLERIAPSGVRVASDRRAAISAVRTAYEGATQSMVGLARASRNGRGPAQDAVPSENDGSPSGGAGGGDDVCELAWGDMQNVAVNYAASVQGQVQQSASGLASMAEILAGVPGRRILLYVGNGLAQTAGLEMFQFVGEVCPQYQAELAFYHATYDMSWLYEEVADRANAARVTFYTIEAASPAIDLGIDAGSPGGVSAQSGTLQPDASTAARMGAAAAPRLVPSTHVQRVADLDRESPLVLMAQQTGGRAILNAGDFAEDFARIAGDLRTYYSLGFSPASAPDGRRHRLEIRLKGGDGYRARHREAYRAKAPAEQMAEKVLGVAQFGLGGNPLAARIEGGEAVARGEGVYRVPVRIFVPLDRLTLVPVPGTAGGSRGRLRVLMTATDARGQLGPVRQKVVPVDVAAAPGGAVAGKVHLVEVELDLAAGPHTVALGVRDDLGGETSYLTAELRVPGAAGE